MNQDNPAYGAHEDHVIVEQRGSLGLVTLNRPSALNALTLEMVRSLCAALFAWEKDSGIKSILIKGAGGRAFCAGGDIKALHKAGMDYRRGALNMKVPAMFFAEEYMLNKQIYNYSKPIISFMNGITMGGGYGLAGNSKYRVITDRTHFAMPEVGIGFFPDVGSMHHLAKFKGYIGRYLALTGQTIDAEDAFYAGAGEYFIKVQHEDYLIDELSGGGEAESVLSSMHVAPDNSAPMDGHADKIESVFAEQEVDGILKSLEDNGSVWASGVFEIMHEQSPSSIYVTAEYLKRTAGKSVEEVLDMDFALAQKFIERSDLYEGISRAVIDRGAQPEWEPVSLKAMSEELVNEYFISTGYDLSDM